LAKKLEVEDEEVTAAVVVDDGLNSDTDASEVVVVAKVIPKKKQKKPKHSVQRKLVKILDAYTVRNFGRIKIEDRAIMLQTMYSSANLLHPLGFLCDRYEFSPVHG